MLNYPGGEGGLGSGTSQYVGGGSDGMNHTGNCYDVEDWAEQKMMEELGIPGMDSDENHHVMFAGTYVLRGLAGLLPEEAVADMHN